MIHVGDDRIPYLAERAERTLKSEVKASEKTDSSVARSCGRFAEQRAAAALADLDLPVAGALHPSPASPLANRGWAKAFKKRLEELGVAG